MQTEDTYIQQKYNEIDSRTWASDKGFKPKVVTFGRETQE